MAGLFEKDIRLIMQRKNVLMILMLLSVFLAYTQEGTFIVSYLPDVTPWYKMFNTEPSS